VAIEAVEATAPAEEEKDYEQQEDADGVEALPDSISQVKPTAS